ncbi:hypothetical protein GA0061102_10874 [Rhizobium miluonense]|uniref:Uncharacterized protein n=1 Tax=Rhizobium miluonense TaxID=411945 RepID=A0A1C3XDI5_9HYPH|nr:hypothetical protein GA0061102_10874 [Rhizobium miluonense]
MTGAGGTLSGIEMIRVLHKRQMQDSGTAGLSVAKQFETLIAVF